MVTIYLKIGSFNLTPSKQFIKDRDYQYFFPKFQSGLHCKIRCEKSKNSALIVLKSKKNRPIEISIGRFL